MPFSFKKYFQANTSKTKRQVIAPVATLFLAYNTILCYVRGLFRKLFVNFSGQKAAVKGSVGGGKKIQRNYFVSFRSLATGGPTATNTRVASHLNRLSIG